MNFPPYVQYYEDAGELFATIRCTLGMSGETEPGVYHTSVVHLPGLSPNCLMPFFHRLYLVIIN